MNTNEENIEHKINQETARIHWHELQGHFASGNVLHISTTLDLIAAAKAIAEDNTTQVKQWLEQNLIQFVSDTQAKNWHQNNTELWAVVIKPLIVVQETTS